MEQKKIDRINELARKAKSPAGLTPEEEAERALLRQEYIAACKSNLMAHLTIPSFNILTAPGPGCGRSDPL